MDKKALEKLEFYKIQERLSSLAYSEGGRKKIEELEPCFEEDQVNAALDETAEAMELLRYSEPSFLSSVKNLDVQLNKARVGGLLLPFELLDIYKLLRASRLTVKYTGTPSAELLQKIAAGIQTNPELEKSIQESIDEDAQIRDDASPELKRTRKQVDNLRQRIKDYLQNFIRSGNKQSLLQDALVTERAGRYVVPVKQEYRNEVKGIVHDESASGATVFIEPLPVVEDNNKIRSLQIEEKREIERILSSLSAAVSEFTEELVANLELLNQLDLIFSRAHLAYEMNAFRPKINSKGIVEISRAKHPLLGEKAVPVDIELGKHFDILVITGPNTGGKTVSLKTIGLLTLMAMCGLFIPARENSQLAIFKDIYVDIGDEQSIEQSLSTFSSHMTNIINILRQADHRSLVLMDELGAGTDPYEGAALARVILEELKKKNCRVIVTTHQSELKTFAYQNKRVENACVEFDPVSLCPTYELTIGTPGQSNAFEIASRLGLDLDLVERSRELVPRQEKEIGNMIRQLKESRYLYEMNVRKMEEEKQELKQAREMLEKERKDLHQEKEVTVNKARQEAEQYVRRIKREADEAIDELKQILKEKKQTPKWHEVEEKRRKIRELGVDLSSGDEVHPEQDIKAGDYVMLKKINQKGYVLDGPNTAGDVVVQVGVMRLTVKKDQLVHSESGEEKKSRKRNQVFLNKVQNISPELDLRGQYAEDALTVLEKYLDDVHLASLDRVRIIHGKGTGALRKAVRDYAKGHPYIKEFRDGLREEGGFGVTVMYMK